MGECFRKLKECRFGDGLLTLTVEAERSNGQSLQIHMRDVKPSASLLALVACMHSLSASIQSSIAKKAFGYYYLHVAWNHPSTNDILRRTEC